MSARLHPSLSRTVRGKAGWSRRGIQTRIVVLVAAGAACATVSLAAVAWISLDIFEREVLAERTMLASAVADRVEHAVAGDLNLLQSLSGRTGIDLSDGDHAPEQNAVRDAYFHAHLVSRIIVLSRDGAVVAVAPGSPEAADRSLLTLSGAQEALREERPVIVSSMRPLYSARGEPDRFVHAFVPLRDRGGEVAGLIAGEMPVAKSRLRAAIVRAPTPHDGSVDLSDEAGHVIATTDPSRLGMAAGHGAAVRKTLRAEGVRAGTCRSCHQAHEGNVDEVVALAPLDIAPWIVAVRQPAGESYASVLALRRGIVLLAPVMLLLAVTFAYGVGRSVVVPVARLTGTAERLADGMLDEPILAPDDDEIGRLARSLERMRLALSKSLQEIAANNRELENRVEERTSELQRLYSQLQERQQTRAQLLRKVISVQEEERKRIARELHDQTCQTVAAVLLAIERIRNESPSQGRSGQLSTAALLAGRALDELHQLIYGLRPSVLDDLGLASAVRWCAERHLGSRGIAFRCEFSGLDDSRLPSAVETAVFRVIQEAITNIERHARADAVLIQCSMNGQVFMAEIEDDGVGFVATAPQVCETGQGLGLLGMRERIELLGGAMEVESAPGRGTRIAFTVPVPADTGVEAEAHV